MRIILPLLFVVLPAASAFAPGAKPAVSTVLHAEGSSGVKQSDYMPDPAAFNPKPTTAQMSAFGIQKTADHESGPYDSMTRRELKELIKLRSPNSGLMALRLKLKGRNKQFLISALNSATIMPFIEPKDAVGSGKHYADTNRDIKNLFAQNREYVDTMKAKDPAYFDTLAAGHAPKYLWIGCADARVPANEIMGEDAGQVFVVRNVANMVVNTDFNLMSALQYAMGPLDIPHIIVCGHYDCGGIRASTENVDHGPPLENWLRNIRDVYRLHHEELDAIKDPEQRHKRLVELNVVEQCLNLFKTGAVQKKRVETFKNEDLEYSYPRIHACVFDPKDGILRQLDVNFGTYLDQYGDIYDLYKVDRRPSRKEKKKIAKSNSKGAFSL
jgi:carbonic anhydrase